MIARSSSGAKSSQSQLSANVSGVGVGTGLVGYAHSLGPNSGLGTLLLFAAPLISFLVTAGLQWLENNTHKKEKVAKEERFKASSEKLRAAISDPQFSETKKKQWLKLLEKITDDMLTDEANMISAGEANPLIEAVRSAVESEQRLATEPPSGG